MTTFRSTEHPVSGHRPPGRAVLDGEVGEAEWDAFVGAHPDGSLHQTSAWSRVKGPGHGVQRVVLRGPDGRIVAGAQLLSRRVAHLVGTGYVPYGPLASTVDDADQVMTLLEAEARRASLSVLLVQPTRSGVDVEHSLRRRGYTQSRIDVATSATFLVDIAGSPDELFARLSKTKRDGIRKARRSGLDIRDGSVADLDAFHQLLTSSAKRHGFLPMSREYLNRQWDELAPLGYLRLIIADLDGEPMAGALFTVFNGVVDFKLTGWELNDRTKNLGVNYAIQWAIIEWACNTGQHTYDLGGMARETGLLLQRDPGDRSIDDEGTRFKSGWGGALHLFPPTYERVQRPLGHLTYRLPAALMADEGLGGRLVNRLRRS